MAGFDDPFAIAAIVLALSVGGLLKGVIGLGAPVIAVPIMSIFVDVPIAVAVMVVPNLLTNLRQGWQYRQARITGPFIPILAVSCGVGAILGTVFLVALPASILKLVVALLVFAFVALRLVIPDFRLSMALAQKLGPVAGIISGVAQGAAGVSAPVSVSFLNAMGLPRERFISTISAMFVGMSLVQIPMLILNGVLTPSLMAISIACLAPLLIFIQIGGHLARHVSAKLFDRLILVVLVGLALILVQSVVT
ncbi:MAG: sulfite exporter TauE/SafE family protein [Pelagimonas sp.]|uniref:sulfite exporter TauE/SafE family protein n=1 Tax=Pelagimonas sp. TaxID=2073170 RepID=UPI003D6A3E9E